ncbi:hypothetical protein C1H46_033517 [Malus baccata]|uniref:Uncharacterized protein n=1 Tax=Malus baccata TaxID=106549 RepID=A0A540L386_MALBA|nr:hypothetical protein C1H46_033517 [Malus baccata]
MAVGRVPPFVPPPGQNIEREEVGVPVVRAQDKRTPKRGPEPAGRRSSLGSEPGTMMLYDLENIVDLEVMKE